MKTQFEKKYPQRNISCNYSHARIGITVNKHRSTDAENEKGEMCSSPEGETRVNPSVALKMAVCCQCVDEKQG